MEIEFPTSHSCPICTAPHRLGKICAFFVCEHIICRVCQPKCEFCPVCKSTELDAVRDPGTVLGAVKKQYSEHNIMVDCPMCEKNMAFLDFVGHDCPGETERCGYSGCEQTVRKSESEKHRSECKYRKIPCSDCGELLLVSTAAEHRRTCKFRIWFLSCCETVVHSQTEQVEHIQKCPLFKVTCKYCTKQFMRVEFGDHFAKCKPF